MPGVRKLAAIEVVPQAIALSVPPQVPLLLEINSIPGLVNSIPRLLNLTVGLVVWATRVYHTSFTTAPAQSPVIATPVRVAPYMVPVEFTQLVDEGKATALPQRSFAGAGSVTQTLNAIVPPAAL